MKVLVVLSCALALAFGWDHQSGGYHGPQHIPVIHKGVPIETPEVQHAKALHLAAVSEASSHHGGFEEHYEGHDGGHDGVFDGHDGGLEHYGGDDGGLEHYGGHEQILEHYGGDEGHEQVLEHYGGHEGQEHNYQYVVEHEQGHSGHFEHHISSHHLPAYETSHGKPQIGHDGKPLDTPEVEIAKAKHFAAVHEALARTASHGSQSHYRRRRGIESYEHEGHYEAPIEFHDVGHEQAFEHGHYEVPIDYQHGGHEVSSHADEHGYTVHQEHAPVYGHHIYHSHEEPQIGHDGKPMDTAEVEHAKAAHFAAHEEAKFRIALHKHGVASHEGPIDTPEVQHAKAEHFAAHAAANAQHQQHHY